MNLTNTNDVLLDDYKHSPHCSAALLKGRDTDPLHYQVENLDLKTATTPCEDFDVFSMIRVDVLWLTA